MCYKRCTIVFANFGYVVIKCRLRIQKYIKLSNFYLYTEHFQVQLLVHEHHMWQDHCPGHCQVHL